MKIGLFTGGIPKSCPSMIQSIARESGRLCPKMTSSDGSFSSPTGSSSRCWLAWLLSEARLSSRLRAMSSSVSSSMSSHGSISPIFVSFHSVCSCLSLSPPRTSRLLFAGYTYIATLRSPDLRHTTKREGDTSVTVVTSNFL